MLNLSIAKEYKIEDRVLETAADLITFEDCSTKCAFTTANELLYPARWYPDNDSIVTEIVENKELFDKVEKAIKNIINYRTEEDPKEVRVGLTMNLSFSAKVPFNIYRANEFSNEADCDDYGYIITDYFQSKFEEILSKIREQNENIGSLDLDSFDIDYME